MACKHENGWVLKEEIAINSSSSNEPFDEHIIECECNNLDCKVRKKIKFDIINIEVVD